MAILQSQSRKPGQATRQGPGPDGAVGTHQTHHRSSCRADIGVQRGRSTQDTRLWHLAFRLLWVHPLSIPCQAAHTVSPRTNCFSSGSDNWPAGFRFCPLVAISVSPHALWAPGWSLTAPCYALWLREAGDQEIGLDAETPGHSGQKEIRLPVCLFQGPKACASILVSYLPQLSKHLLVQASFFLATILNFLFPFICINHGFFSL